MRRCPHCQRWNRNEWAFCICCRRRIDPDLVYYAQPITAEQLYEQDKRRRKWDEENGGVTLYINGETSMPGWYGDVLTHQILVHGWW